MTTTPPRLMPTGTTICPSSNARCIANTLWSYFKRFFRIFTEIVVPQSQVAEYRYRQCGSLGLPARASLGRSSLQKSDNDQRNGGSCNDCCQYQHHLVTPFWRLQRCRYLERSSARPSIDNQESGGALLTSTPDPMLGAPCPASDQLGVTPESVLSSWRVISKTPGPPQRAEACVGT